MPAEETPRQKKQASTPPSSASIAEKSEKSEWTISRSFSCAALEGRRTIERTLCTSTPCKHSRSTPCPTMPLAPKRTTFTDDEYHSPPERRHRLAEDFARLVHRP